MSPGECGFGLPLIHISGVAKTGQDSNNNIKFCVTDPLSCITITRIQEAAPPIGGTFAVTYGDKVKGGIIQKLLIFLGIGTINISLVHNSNSKCNIGKRLY